MKKKLAKLSVVFAVLLLVVISILFPVAGAIVFVMWYWFGEGCTEGYTWADPMRRHMNLIIKPGKHDSTQDSKGWWCYHTWRVTGENVGMYGGMIMFGVLVKLGVPIWSILLYYAGATFAGIFFYERVFNYIAYNDLWPQKVNWDFLNGTVSIPRRPWHDILFLAIGIVLITLA